MTGMQGWPYVGAYKPLRKNEGKITFWYNCLGALSPLVSGLVVCVDSELAVVGRRGGGEEEAEMSTASPSRPARPPPPSAAARRRSSTGVEPGGGSAGTAVMPLHDVLDGLTYSTCRRYRTKLCRYNNDTVPVPSAGGHFQCWNLIYTVSQKNKTPNSCP